MNLDNVVASKFNSRLEVLVIHFPYAKDKSGLKNTDSIDMGNTTWQTR